jgi:hypothetical protein
MFVIEKCCVFFAVTDSQTAYSLKLISPVYEELSSSAAASTSGPCDTIRLSLEQVACSYEAAGVQ